MRTETNPNAAPQGELVASNEESAFVLPPGHAATTAGFDNVPPAMIRGGAVISEPKLFRNPSAAHYYGADYRPRATSPAEKNIPPPGVRGGLEMGAFWGSWGTLVDLFGVFFPNDKFASFLARFFPRKWTGPKVRANSR